MQNISLFLIHNQDPGRSATQNAVALVCQHELRISQNEIYEVYWQSPHLNLQMNIRELCKLIFRQYFRASLFANKKFFLEESFVRVYRKKLSIFVSSIIFTINNVCLKKKRCAQERKFIIERILIDKHIYSWTALANGNSDWAIVLEDDVLLRTESVTGDAFYADTFSKLSLNFENFDFTDLAGGYTFDSKEISRFPVDTFFHNSGLCFAGVWTNTTCAYLISKRTAREAVELLQRQPDLRDLGVGFVLNLLSESTTKFTTLWPKILPFQHGTFTGKFESTIFKRSPEY